MCRYELFAHFIFFTFWRILCQICSTILAQLQWDVTRNLSVTQEIGIGLTIASTMLMTLVSLSTSSGLYCSTVLIAYLYQRKVTKQVVIDFSPSVVVCRLSLPLPHLSHLYIRIWQKIISPFISPISLPSSPVIIAVMEMFGDCKVKAERRDEGRDMGEMKGEMKIRRSLYLLAFQPIDGRDGRLLVKTLRYSSIRHAYRCYPSVFNQHHQFL